jgi:YegS/Rv2252/BmrU family lipid kinase
MLPSIVIIINPVSGPARRGRGAERLAQARRSLDRLGVSGDVRVTERGGHAHELALEASAAAAELVIAWGGDGTINEVARALVQREEGGVRPPHFGIIPGGSGNGLARHLKIPFDPSQAIAHAIGSPARAIDAGELGEHLFFNVAGIGQDAHIAALVSTRVHHRGLLPYVKATLGDLLRYRAVDYTIEVDGQTIRTAALIVALANSSQYGFGAHIAPAAELDDGTLDLVTVEDRGIVGNLARVPSMFVGRIDRRAGVQVRQIREMTIRSARPMLFHVDGEAVQGSDTLVARVHPKALQLRA